MGRCLSGFGTMLARVLVAGALFGALSSAAQADDLDSGLARLAEILGAAHHLREVCGADEGMLWRNKMIDLLSASKADPARREVLITHFNNAYYRYRSLYPTCTAKAAAEANSLFDEGHRLALRLAGGNPDSAYNF